MEITVRAGCECGWCIAYRFTAGEEEYLSWAVNVPESYMPLMRARVAARLSAAHVMRHRTRFK